MKPEPPRRGEDAASADRAFFAMGSPCRIVAWGDPGSLCVIDREVDHAIAAVERLEACWSRFRPDSELNAIAGGRGFTGWVTPTMRAALQTAAQLWRATDGLFDPTIRDDLERLGYDRPFRELSQTGVAPAWHDAVGGDLARARTATEPRRARQPRGDNFGSVQLDPDGHVEVPAGIRLDLGGLGKGLAADFIARQLVTNGARRVAVSLGGDVRVAGVTREDATWTVPVENPFHEGEVLFEHVCEGGAMITTTTRFRRWSHDGHTVHHLVDPRTGQSADNGIVAIVATADTAWWAEGIAKAALIAGPDSAVEIMERSGVGAWIFLTDGSVRRALDVAPIAHVPRV